MRNSREEEENAVFADAPGRKIPTGQQLSHGMVAFAGGNLVAGSCL